MTSSAPTSRVSRVGVKEKKLHLLERALHGVVGEWVEEISPFVEADPAGIAVSLLVGFGSAIGRTAGMAVGTSRHSTNEFALLVGPTAAGRKGVAMTTGLRPVRLADPVWEKRVRRGFGSGESIISYFFGDPHSKNDVNAVSRDDRLLLHEGEFAHVLTVAARDGSTMSSLLRAAWDGDPLENHTKTHGHLEVPDAHLSVLAGVTEEELRQRVTETDIANGFLNRFLLVSVERPRLLPDPPPIPDSLYEPHVRSIKDALAYARRYGHDLRRDKGAKDLWDAAYETELSIERSGLAGAVCSRAEAHTLRLSMLYALLHRSRLIRAEHVEAALALWRYCEQSARLIFGDGTGDTDLDKILVALEEAGRVGMVRSQLRDLFSGNRSSQHVEDCLCHGERIGRVVRLKEASDGRGRPAERAWATAYAPKEALDRRGERLLAKLRPLVRESASNGAEWDEIRESLIHPAQQQHGVTLGEAQMHELLMLTEPDLEGAA